MGPLCLEPEHNEARSSCITICSPWHTGHAITHGKAQPQRHGLWMRSTQPGRRRHRGMVLGPHLQHENNSCMRSCTPDPPSSMATHMLLHGCYALVCMIAPAMHAGPIAPSSLAHAPLHSRCLAHTPCAPSHHTCIRCLPCSLRDGREAGAPAGQALQRLFVRAKAISAHVVAPIEPLPSSVLRCWCGTGVGRLTLMIAPRAHKHTTAPFLIRKGPHPCLPQPIPLCPSCFPMRCAAGVGGAAAVQAARHLPRV